MERVREQPYNRSSKKFHQKVSRCLKGLLILVNSLSKLNVLKNRWSYHGKGKKEADTVPRNSNFEDTLRSMLQLTLT